MPIYLASQAIISKIMKQLLLKLYYFGNLSKEETNKNQMLIRDTEWSAIEPYIRKGNFLDVGCGAGYSMKKAQEYGCKSYGIDPNPGGHGVGREGSGFQVNVDIKQGFAEKIDFNSQMFDTVYSSHVLEHVNSEQESLREMSRVLKDDGVLIIGMPTNFIVKWGWIAQTLLMTHQKVVNLLFGRFINTGKTTFREIFIPNSHSHAGKTAWFDLKYYKIENWKKIVSSEFDIVETLLPAYYPYPEFYQFFKLYKSETKGSSVFFICKKK
jgi:ubiquinone/menaquinone biosynthesis C-methylase UbiE